MMQGEFCWNELATRDVEKAKKFYSAMFGWQFEEYDTGELIYTLVKSGDKKFAGIWQIPEADQAKIPPHWMSYILVSDLKAAVENAKKNGATVIVDVKKVGDMGQLAVIIDPVGAHLAFWEAAK
jgi:predicted enzyme related to lactoylglutathione lyase